MSGKDQPTSQYPIYAGAADSTVIDFGAAAAGEQGFFQSQPDEQLGFYSYDQAEAATHHHTAAAQISPSQ